MSSQQTTCTTESGQMMATRYGEVSGVQAEKIQKLRVNRVAIIQALRVDHVIPYLIGKNVITEGEKKVILGAKTTQDKTRKLLNILPTKGRTVDWYGAFRDALKCPDTRSSDVKKKYSILIEFLDNTILPAHERNAELTADNMKLPKYEPLPSIGDSESSLKNAASSSRVTFDGDFTQDNKNGNSPTGQEKGEIDKESIENAQKEDDTLKQRKTLLKGFFHKWVPAPEAFTSLIPEQKFEQLKSSTDSDDKIQLKQEEDALKRIHNMEIVFALDKQQKLPEGFEICMSSAAEQLLADANLYHLYLKYFEQLKTDHGIDMPKHLAASFSNLVEILGDAGDDEIRDNVVKLAFGLFDMLNQCGIYDDAEKVILGLVVYLSSTAEMNAWLSTYEAFVKLMSIRNQNMNFSDADAVYNAAQQMVHKIQLMSFGKNLLSQCRLNIELSVLMREQGSIGPSYFWALETLKLTKSEDHQTIVDVLCNASLAFANKLLVKKAEELAIQAVKYAKSFFGTRHPTYIQALINYCHYSNEYRQDDMGIVVARRALETCEKIYGCIPTVQKALCHQVLARALVANYQFTDDEYYDEATKAWKMAIVVLPGSHPRLALFRYTLAQCLLWQASHCSPGKRQGMLVWAMTECSGALTRFKLYWGDFSLKVGQAYSLLGQIYTNLDEFPQAEQYLINNVKLHEISAPERSHFVHLARASLGAFYKDVDKPLEGLELLQSVADNIDCGGIYLKWVHVCYDAIIDLLNAINREKDAEMYQATLVDWMKKNPKPSHQLTWEHLHATPEPYDKFLNQFDSTSVRFKEAKEALIAAGSENLEETGKC